MNKHTITAKFGIVGSLSWACAALLREIMINSINIFDFVLGIMPNISACWFFIWMGEIIINRMNNKFTFKVASIVSGIIFLFAIISELIHDRFLSSPFDVNDIIATILAITLYLIIFYISKNEV